MSKQTPPPLNDIKVTDVHTPSKTDVLSKEDVEESKKLRDFNINFLQQHMRNHQISISQAIDHFF